MTSLWYIIRLIRSVLFQKPQHFAVPKVPASVETSNKIAVVTGGKLLISSLIRCAIHHANKAPFR